MCTTREKSLSIFLSLEASDLLQKLWLDSQDRTLEIHEPKKVICALLLLLVADCLYFQHILVRNWCYRMIDIKFLRLFSAQPSADSGDATNAQIQPYECSM